MPQCYLSVSECTPLLETKTFIRFSTAFHDCVATQTLEKKQSPVFINDYQEMHLVFMTFVFILDLLFASNVYENGNMTRCLSKPESIKWTLKSEVMLQNNSRIMLCPIKNKRGISDQREPTVPLFCRSQKVDLVVSKKLCENQAVALYYLNENKEHRVWSFSFRSKNVPEIQCFSLFVRLATVVV